MRACFAAVVTLAAVLITPAPADAAGFACGDTVLADVVLESDLVNCPTGLVAGADNITIDLNGHSIEGQSVLAGAGVEAVGRVGIRVIGGSISGFGTGVRLQDSSLSSVEGVTVSDADVGVGVSRGYSNRVLRNQIARVGHGVVFSAPSTVVSGNRLETIGETGIWCRDSGLIEGNRVVGATTGIGLVFCVADVVGNETSANRGVGILRIRSGGLTARNRANANGSGIVSDDSHGLFTGNVTNGNAHDGLTIVDQIDTHGPLHAVEDHVAMANGGLGITTNLLGVVQLGKIRARANGDPRECLNVVCN